VVKSVLYYYTRSMEYIDPRISAAINLIADATNQPVTKTGAMLYPYLISMQQQKQIEHRPRHRPLAL
jgi:hypothetical protein